MIEAVGGDIYLDLFHIVQQVRFQCEIWVHPVSVAICSASVPICTYGPYSLIILSPSSGVSILDRCCLWMHEMCLRSNAQKTELIGKTNVTNRCGRRSKIPVCTLTETDSYYVCLGLERMVSSEAGHDIPLFSILLFKLNLQENGVHERIRTSDPRIHTTSALAAHLHWIGRSWSGLSLHHEPFGF